MFLYPEHVFCYIFHFRALPCPRLLLRVFQQLQELGEGQGGRWEPRLCLDKEEKGKLPALGGIPGSAGLLRGSPSPAARAANIPNARAAPFPTTFPKRAASECFPGNPGEGGVGNPFCATFGFI